MQDRNVLHPEYYMMEKVEGTENIVKLTPAPGEVYEEGTLINKATLWKDATAALFGLGVDSLPDDGFAYLGKYAQHWWRRRSVAGHYRVVVSEQSTPSISGIDNYFISKLLSATSGGGYDAEISVPYSDNVTIDPSGKITGLAEPIKYLTYTYRQYQQLASLVGKYVQQTTKSRTYGTVTYGKVFQIPSETGGPVHDVDESKYSYHVWYSVTGMLSTEYVSEIGPWEYVRSSIRSQYPDSGEQDGYEYEYLGIPFDNAVGAPKVEQISYIGTGGTAGHTNPVVIKTSFRPKFAFIISADRASSSDFTAFAVGSDKTPTFNYVNEFLGNWAFNLTSEKVIMMQFNDDSLKIADVLNRDVNTQCNSIGKTYVAIIFG